MTAHKKLKTESGRFGRFFVFGATCPHMSETHQPPRGCMSTGPVGPRVATHVGKRSKDDDVERGQQSRFSEACLGKPIPLLGAIG